MCSHSNQKDLCQMTPGKSFAIQLPGGVINVSALLKDKDSLGLSEIFGYHLPRHLVVGALHQYASVWLTLFFLATKHLTDNTAFSVRLERYLRIEKGYFPTFQ